MRDKKKMSKKLCPEKISLCQNIDQKEKRKSKRKKATLPPDVARIRSVDFTLGRSKGNAVCIEQFSFRLIY